MTSDPSVSSRKSPSAQALLAAAPGEQITAAIGAEKWARAADLLALNGERLLLEGDHEQIVGWLSALPDEHVHKSAKLATLYAWALVYQQRYQEALTKLSLAERTLQTQKLAEAGALRHGEVVSDELELKPHAELEQSMHAVRAHLASVTGDHARIPKSVEAIMLPASADHPAWRAAALVTLGRCRYLAGDLRGAKDDLEAAHMLASQSRGARAARIVAQADVLLAKVAIARGALRDAERHVAALASGADAEARAAAAVTQAEVALWRNDRAAARAALAAELPAAADPISVHLDGGIVLAYLDAIDGFYDEARARLDALEKQLAGKNIRWPGELLAAHRARLALIRGDDASARRWFQGVSLVQRPSDRMSPTGAFQVLTKAHFELKSDAAAALASAGRALAFGEETGHRLVMLEAQILMGLACHVLGRRDEARSALVAALEGARAEGVAKPFLVKLLDDAMEALALDDPQAHALREAARALPGSAAGRERPHTPRPGTAVMPGPIETKQAPPATASSATAPAATSPDAAEPDAAEAPTGPAAEAPRTGPAAEAPRTGA